VIGIDNVNIKVKDLDLQVCILLKNRWYHF
jgi:hypothetical protein